MCKLVSPTMPSEMSAPASKEAGVVGAPRGLSVLEGQQEDQWVQREEAVVADGAGDPQDVVVQPLGY